MVELLILIVAVAIGIVVSVYRSKLTDRRRAELSAVAMRLGFSFKPRKDEGFAMGWGFLTRLAQGADRYAFNILRGDLDGHTVFVYDYHYRTGTDEEKSHHYCTFLMLIVHEVFPELKVGPENLLSKMAAAFGYEDISFESREFSRTFCVRSKDRQFAYAVCNPQMMEYLLANRDLELEIQGPVIMLASRGQLPATEIELNLRRLARIRSLLPDYLFITT